MGKFIPNNLTLLELLEYYMDDVPQEFLNKIIPKVEELIIENIELSTRVDTLEDKYDDYS